MAQNFTGQDPKTSKSNLFKCLSVLVFFMYICTKCLFILYPMAFCHSLLTRAWLYLLDGFLVGMGRMLLSTLKAIPSTGLSAPCQRLSSPTLLTGDPSLMSCSLTNVFLFWIALNWILYSSCGLMTTD